MAGSNVHELRPKTGSESEKITINLGHVDLGHIDLLVRDGFYANRTDFIRTAIRNQVERHAEATRQSVSRRGLDLGLRHVSREELETARTAQRPLDRASCFGSAQHLEPTTEAVIARRRYWLHVMPRSANALC
jgi:Arc/MetJ-type ribon-helix-helix transcriptional regulator